jgi:hypothetical protein
VALLINFATTTSFAQKLTVDFEEMPPARVEITIEKLQNDNKIFWPMMPGDTLQQLAIKFYPNSPILQQRFILKTISLTKLLGLDIQAQSLFKAPQFIIIPNESAVREVTHRIKSAEEERSKPDTLKLSYGLDFSMPNYETVEQVDSKLHLALASFKMPSLSLPEVKLPKMELPKIELKVPSLNLTTLKNKVSNQWSSISQRSLLLTENLSQQTLSLINDYKHKNLIQILNNYRLRNASLIGILILVFAFLWVAHKRRQRSQALMLSSIGGTISNEGHDQSTSAELVDQIESLMTENKVTIPDVEDFKLTNEFTNIELEEDIDIKNTDKQSLM